MLNLYDPRMSPSAAVVKLLTGTRPMEAVSYGRNRTTESQVLFLMEPFEEADNAVEETHSAERRRLAA